jgi:hypothetical protein
MIEAERLAPFHFWRAVGARMGIEDIPADYATRELFAGWFPRPLRPVVRRAIYALPDDTTRRAFGFPAPNPVINGLVIVAMKARAIALRFFPRRRRPSLRTEMTHPTYPKGYDVRTLGP